METRKILGIIFSLLFLGAFAFVLSWGIINFNKVKDSMSGTQIYDSEDINKAYQDGYDTALKDKEEYTELINGYRDTITTLNDNISQLNSQITNLTKDKNDSVRKIDELTTQKTNLQVLVDNLTSIKESNESTITDLNSQITNLQSQVKNLTNSGEDKSEQIANLNTQITNLQNTVSQLQTTNKMNLDTITSLNSQISSLNDQISEMTENSQNYTGKINALNSKISELQKSIAYYEAYIAQLENAEQVVATFEFDGSVYNIQIVNKGSKLSVVTPTSTEYKIFNGWTVNGQAIDLNTFTITTNTKIVADITYKFDVKFKVENEIVSNQIIVKDNFASLPSNPTKEGYEFDGWSLNGVNVISNIATKPVTENTTYIAVFTKLHTVTFVYENETKSTQTIRNGELAKNVSITNTDYKVFNGWKVDNKFVEVSSYAIYNDITFIADITYKYDVKFKVDDAIYNSQIVTKNEYATLPTNPAKDGYEFDGWSINGVDILTDIATTKVSENITYLAVFTKLYSVQFVNDGVTLSSQIVRDGNCASLPSSPSKYGYNFGGWSLNGTDIVSNIETKPVTENTIYTAIFHVADVDIEHIKKTAVGNGNFPLFVDAPVKNHKYSKIIISYNKMTIYTMYRSGNSFVKGDTQTIDKTSPLIFEYDASRDKYLLKSGEFASGKVNGYAYSLNYGSLERSDEMKDMTTGKIGGYYVSLSDIENENYYAGVEYIYITSIRFVA